MRKNSIDLIRDKFSALYEVEDECWNWKLSTNSLGYGKIKIDGKWHRAHRISFQIHFGPIPDGMFVCHRCDNPRCVRPSHLFLGTPKQNTQDMIQKGRSSAPPRCGNQQMRGAKNPKARLKEADVLSIRSAIANGASLKATSNEYGVTAGTIYEISIRRTWSWLKDT